MLFLIRALFAAFKKKQKTIYVDYSIGKSLTCYVISTSSPNRGAQIISIFRSTMTQYDMVDSTAMARMNTGYKLSSVETTSLSSLSSACSSSLNSSFEIDHKINVSSRKEGKYNISTESVTYELKDEAHNPVVMKNGESVQRRKVGLKEGSPEKSMKSDPCNFSFGLSEDDWTTQGNRTEKTEKTGTTEGTFYTGLTDATGATKLHQNGVSAMLHRKLKKNKNSKSRIDSSPVPTSINTIRRPMSFDNRINSNSSDLVAPSEVNMRTTTSYQKKIYTKSKLKEDPASYQIRDEFNCMFSGDDYSTDSGNNTVDEDASYHAGSKSIGGFIRSIFLCCQSDYSVRKRK